ncbi:hypothetical protein SDC9_189755 [bioreactor metagenome]|uniref:Uncharacterized protein n=1 Tax=bioreactor metagenome TaxID=1076179 RepID=A0A645HVH5_9ZZZZ
MDDDFYHRRMQLVAVAHRSRTALDIADVAALIRDQNGAFKLPGFFCIDTEIGRQFHGATHAFRYINKRAVRCHRCIQRGKEVVITWNHGAQILFYQLRMIVNRLTERTENNALFRQFVAIGGRHRYRVKNSINRHLFAFTDRYAKLFKGILDLFT